MSLPSASFLPLDSLPYLDPPSHPDYAAYALTLIEDEMQAMQDEGLETGPDLYLKNVKGYEPNFTQLTEHCLSEISSNEGSTPVRPPLRPSTWGTAPQNSLSSDVQAWKSSVKNLKSKIELEHTNLINLELLSTFGSTSHLLSNSKLQSLQKSLQSNLDSLRLEVDTINSSRKESQESVKVRYTNLNNKWLQLVRANYTLKRAIEDKEVSNKKQKTL
ncbi:hypothetical protein TrST_g13054 [Triparma strigata]|uniref:Pre-mRNA-splicing factor SPF27 n=1 Tax=Triparma strigata TaxID=1606541 RepID=A0A9W7B7D1_9STRA|nr:hypothetical protein TrST_g13054 [Triparma strigata]